MDRILNSITCADMRERWYEVVPHILGVAKLSKSRNVQEILMYYEDDEFFGE